MRVQGIRISIVLVGVSDALLSTYWYDPGDDDRLRGRAAGGLRDGGGEGLQDGPGAGLRQPQQP